MAAGNPDRWIPQLGTSIAPIEVVLKVTSPIATGGGGDHFEQHVAAFMLGLLLARTTPPILNNTSVVEVHLQTAHPGWQTDDVLDVAETRDGSRRKLAAQVKRRFRLSTSDQDCRRTIQGMWNDFLSVDRFSNAADRLATVDHTPKARWRIL